MKKFLFQPTFDSFSIFHDISPDDNNSDSASKIQKSDPKWGNYVRGVCALFINETGKELPGCDFVIGTTVPLGGGLSSSASLEVSVATFLEELTGIKLTLMKKTLLCQMAEHKYAGAPCGIMDQFVSVHAKEGHALLLDCKDCSFKNVPMLNYEVIVLVTNSNVKHNVADGLYAGRQAECFKSASVCKQDSLREVTLPMLEAHKSELDEDTYKRGLHVVGEDVRTSKAAEVLQAGDFETFGRLMNESHNSLRDNFEVSCKELDELVEIARKNKGVYGSRMTGGGFGGCTVTLVKSSEFENLMAQIKEQYSGTPSFIVANAGAGARVLKL